MEVNKESAAEWLQDALITVSNCFVKTYVIIILGELQYAASDFPVEAAAIWSHWTHLPAPPLKAESCPRPGLLQWVKATSIKARDDIIRVQHDLINWVPPPAVSDLDMSAGRGFWEVSYPGHRSTLFGAHWTNCLSSHPKEGAFPLTEQTGLPRTSPFLSSTLPASCSI